MENGKWEMVKEAVMTGRFSIDHLPSSLSSIT